MTVEARPQLRMEEEIHEDKELEALLEKREELKKGIAEYRKADKDAKTKIRSMEIPPRYRVGRFVIERKNTPSKSVAFEVAESIRINIKLFNAED
jgi:hypothetical protein